MPGIRRPREGLRLRGRGRGAAAGACRGRRRRPGGAGDGDRDDPRGEQGTGTTPEGSRQPARRRTSRRVTSRPARPFRREAVGWARARRAGRRGAPVRRAARALGEPPAPAPRPLREPPGSPRTGSGAVGFSSGLSLVRCGGRRGGAAAGGDGRSRLPPLTLRAFFLF